MAWAAAQAPPEKEVPPGDGRSLPGGQGVGLLVVLLGAVIALRFLRWRGKRPALEPRTGAQGSSPAPLPGMAPRSGQHPDATRLYLEIGEFARELEGRMDTKLAYLRRLIAEAERVGADLERAIQTARARKDGAGEPAAPEAAASPDLSGPEVGTSAPDGQEDLHSRILRLWEAGRPGEAIAEEVGVPRGEVDLVLSLHRASRKVAEGDRA